MPARLHLDLNVSEPTSPLSQVTVEQAKKPLLFVQKFLTRSFDALKILTVGNLLDMGAEQLSGQAGWGQKKLEVLQALQRLYVQISKAGATADRGTKVADLVERVLIPSEAVAATSVLEFIANSTNSFGLKGAALSDLEQSEQSLEPNS